MRIISSAVYRIFGIQLTIYLCCGDRVRAYIYEISTKKTCLNIDVISNRKKAQKKMFVELKILISFSLSLASCRKVYRSARRIITHVRAAAYTLSSEV